MAKRTKKSATKLAVPDPALPSDPALLGDVCKLIEAARQRTAQAVNSALVTMYWQIGKRIREDVLQEERAEYGKEIHQTLSEELTTEYGRGCSRANLSSMLRFAEIFPDERIVQTLSAQLSWSHFVQLIPIQDPLKRDFYADMCRVERWSVRTLRHKISHLFYERTAVSKKPDDFRDEVLARLLELNEQRAREERLAGKTGAAAK